MRIDVHHPAFESQRLSVETASLLGGPKLYLNGIVVKRRKGRYPATSDAGVVTILSIAIFLAMAPALRPFFVPHR